MNSKQQFIHQITIKDTKVYLKTSNISFMEWVTLQWDMIYVLNILELFNILVARVGGFISTTRFNRYHKSRLFFFPENPDYQHIRSLNRSKVMKYTQGSRSHNSWRVCGTLLTHHMQDLSHKNIRMLPSTEHFQLHFHQETSWKVFLYTAIKGKLHIACQPGKKWLHYLMQNRIESSET